MPVLYVNKKLRKSVPSEKVPFCYVKMIHGNILLVVIVPRVTRNCCHVLKCSVDAPKTRSQININLGSE